MGTKAAPNLQIPTCQETKAYRALCQVFRNDPILLSVTTMFVSWSDRDEDLWEPSWNFCPWLKINPAPTESDWITESQHTMPVTVQMQVATQGTNVDNLMNYWALIRAAIFPQTDVASAEAVRNLLMSAGVNKPTINLNGFGYNVDDAGNRILIANGTIRLGLFVGT